MEDMSRLSLAVLNNQIRGETEVLGVTYLVGDGGGGIRDKLANDTDFVVFSSKSSDARI